ncbi:MAG: hypothetical protein LBD67_00895 [Candidatus Accumulibacter sp.]|nr:hypothetical protein [Accumulibacter sp.]
MKQVILGLFLAALSSQSFAAVGYLISCETGRQNGKLSFIGKYDVNGQQVIRYFSRSQVRYCPTQVEIQ